MVVFWKAGDCLHKNAMVALTDFDWYSCLLNNNIGGNINFWTPTPWNVKNLSAGDKVYFLLKEKYGRKICGHGTFVKYEINNIPNAWSEYGLGNGVINLETFRLRVKKYTDRNSKIGYKGDSHNIGCLILNNICLFQPDEQKTPAFYGWEIPRTVVKYKYVSDESIDNYGDQKAEKDFKLVDFGVNSFTYNKTKKRVGQTQFRFDVMKAYNYRCCITGETTPEILQAAHIQQYISEESNHIQNGLFLRVDFHTLFDAGLITINDEFKICISRYLTSEYYSKYAGQKIRLPSAQLRPSIIAIRWHNGNVFRG